MRSAQEPHRARRVIVTLAIYGLMGYNVLAIVELFKYGGDARIRLMIFPMCVISWLIYLGQTYKKCPRVVRYLFFSLVASVSVLEILNIVGLPKNN